MNICGEVSDVLTTGLYLYDVGYNAIFIINREDSKTIYDNPSVIYGAQFITVAPIPMMVVVILKMVQY